MGQYSILLASGHSQAALGHFVDDAHPTALGTQDIQEIIFNHAGQQITLIDTPGFDDSNDTMRSDADILKDIADFLQKSYNANQLLTGVIWLQPVLTTRAPGGERRRARLFKKILGEDAYKGVVIGTTMWSKIANEAYGMMQMEQRQAQVWADVIAGGAWVTRHDDNKASADRIINHILKVRRTHPPKPLQIQAELAQDGKLCNTSAGQQLDSDMGEMVAKLRRELEELLSDRDASRKEFEELQAHLSRVERERLSLRKYMVSSSLRIRAF